MGLIQAQPPSVSPYPSRLPGTSASAFGLCGCAHAAWFASRNYGISAPLGRGQLCSVGASLHHHRPPPDSMLNRYGEIRPVTRRLAMLVRALFLLAECSVAAALEYLAGFQVEMRAPLWNHIERDVELVIFPGCTGAFNIENHSDAPPIDELLGHAPVPAARPVPGQWRPIAPGRHRRLQPRRS
jgi:hypothetical protein